MDNSMYYYYYIYHRGNVQQNTLEVRSTGVKCKYEIHLSGGTVEESTSGMMGGSTRESILKIQNRERGCLYGILLLDIFVYISLHNTHNIPNIIYIYIYIHYYIKREDGWMYNGEWACGLQHGVGVQISPQGKERRGIWQNGSFLHWL